METLEGASGLDASDLADLLRALIADMGDVPDQPLPTERDLASRFGVGRRAVRSALAELEFEGRVWRRQGKGTFTAPARLSATPSLDRLVSRTNFFEVIEVRYKLEPILVQLAAERASGDQIAMLRRIAERNATRTLDLPAATIESWDSAFHRHIAEAAGNRLFIDLYDVIDKIRLDPSWQIYRSKARTLRGLALSARQHLEIVDAIAGRDPQRGAAIMREHISSIQNVLAQAVSEE
ncbi:FadR/GntR family transcriptional regulator [Ancylobacter mangrovi]|uniref:FadR/GntR family transcriptional regulator n=1 Tax=Ancylobacter mangrovi TaxID=2972472 RepID=UPI00216278B3|nr:FadR/GntR family transcriptional regulator [Ancylobacter mangrovi]MCS0501929.1 FadR family transcriptional regulator [Ancylobacter mangrovi]